MNEKPASLVLLALYRGIIAFDQWVEVENETERGVAAKCQDGSDEFYVALSNPSYGDCLGVDMPQDVTFESLRKATMDAGGWDELDLLPWCDFDENDEILPETDTLKRLVGWLRSPLGSDGWTDWEISLMEHWAVDEATIYAPGMQIYEALSDAERQELKLSYGDARGGPGSSVPCVTTTASLDLLNETMRTRGLPYIFVSEKPFFPD
jgi:hypothetical protein